MTSARLFRLGWQLLLAVFLLLMQQGGLRHGLQHIKGEDSTPTHQLCKDCLSFHAAAEAVHTAPVSIALRTELGNTQVAPVSARPHAASPAHYFARGPPPTLV